MLLVLILTEMLVGSAFAVPVILAGLDPYYYILKSHFPSILESSHALYLSQIVVRYIITQWCTLETTRIYAHLAVVCMLGCKLYLECLDNIGNTCLNLGTVRFYHELQCINQRGM